MNPKAEETLKRIKRLIIDVVSLIDQFPKTTASFKIAGQVMDSITSIGANFVEAQSARSRKEFASIMGVVLRETRETIFWLDITQELKLVPEKKVDIINQECIELAKIFSSAILTISEEKK